MSGYFRNIAQSLVLTLSWSGLVACSSSETTPGGAGASNGTGGSSTTPNGTGGSSTTPNGTGGGSGAGGVAAGGTGGSTSAGTGTAGTDGKLCPLPAQALFIDFTYSGTGDASQIHFGSTGTLSGGEYLYPTSGSYPLVSDMTGNSWHISGDIGDYSGFGLYFDGCSRIDASAYAGISFKVSGTVEQDGGITLVVDTLNDTIKASWLNEHGGTAKDTDPGRCEPPADAANQWAQSTCLAPTQMIPITDTPTVQSILWSDFSGGKPDANVEASDIVAIHWFFPNPPGAGTTSPTPYKVDITLDDLSFIKQ
jgi:hypothetical protein